MNTQLYFVGLKILVLNTSDSYVCLKSTGFPGGKSTTYIIVKNRHKLEPRTPLLWKRAEWPCMGSGSICLGFREHTHCSLVQRSGSSLQTVSLDLQEISVSSRLVLSVPIKDPTVPFLLR